VLTAPAEALGRLIMTSIFGGLWRGLVGPAVTPVLEVLTEWNRLLIRNFQCFVAWVTLVVVATLIGAGGDALARRVLGAGFQGHPAASGAFALVEVTCGLSAAVSVMRMGLTAQYVQVVLDTKQKMPSREDTEATANAVRERYRRAYRRLQPRSLDVLIPLGLGIGFAMLFWTGQIS
jgi:hypothetical protein